MKTSAPPIAGSPATLRVLPRVAGIETLDGLEIGEPSAIPDARPRMIKRASPERIPPPSKAPVSGAGIVKVNGAPGRPLTQQERDILSRRSNRR